MPCTRTLLALGMLAAVTLVGCKDPVDSPETDVRVASIDSFYCDVENYQNRSGHVDWYQGESQPYDDYDLVFGTITRAYDCYPGDPDRAYPRKNGYCVFTVPEFESPGMVPVCTLFYYQTAHSGSAALRVNWVTFDLGWPAPLGDTDDFFWEIASSSDTAGVDAAHASDNQWYRVPLTPAAGAAIHAAAGGLFITGWVYPDAEDGTYASVAGVGDYSPRIKVVYEDEP